MGDQEKRQDDGDDRSVREKMNDVSVDFSFLVAVGAHRWAQASQPDLRHDLFKCAGGRRSPMKYKNANCDKKAT